MGLLFRGYSTALEELMASSKVQRLRVPGITWLVLLGIGACLGLLGGGASGARWIVVHGLSGPLVVTLVHGGAWPSPMNLVWITLWFGLMWAAAAHSSDLMHIIGTLAIAAWFIVGLSVGV